MTLAPPLEAPTTTAQTCAPTTQLHGTAAGGGIYFGMARVVRRLVDLDALRPGEVLVAPALTPALTVLLSVAGAVVTDRPATISGGLALAREFHVPAVVALDGATDQIATGDEVLVDGTSGAVTVVHHSRR